MKKYFGRSFAIDMAVGFAISVGVFSIRKGFSLNEWPLLAAALCDACFVPGILLVCFAGFVFVSNDGVFDMLSYGVQKAVRIVLSEKRRSKYPDTFYDYKKLKWEKQKGTFGHFISSGAIFLLLSVLFLLMSEAYIQQDDSALTSSDATRQEEKGGIRSGGSPFVDTLPDQFN